jgi:hypothetical protein
MILLVEDNINRLNKIKCSDTINIINCFDFKEFKDYEIICIHKSIENFNEKNLENLNKKIVIFSGGISDYHFKSENFLEIDVDLFYKNFCFFIKNKEFFSLIYGKNFKLNTLLEFYDNISFFIKNNEIYRIFEFEEITKFNNIKKLFDLKEIKSGLNIEKKDLIEYKKYIYNLIQKLINENFACN